MMIEGQKPDYNSIVVTAETPIRLICRHDFWDQAGLMDFGDIILCQRCNQYFTKVRHMPRVIRAKPFQQTQADGQLIKGTIKAKANHWDKICMVRVPVRILDEEDDKNEK